MVTIKNILCPIDFSDFSRRAFDRSVAVAKAAGATVTALHVAPFSATPFYPYSEQRGLVAFTLADGDREKLNTELKRFLDVSTPMGVPVICEVADAPNVADEILARADRLPADLIVMGTHGRSGFQRLFLGSVTEKVLRTAQPAVLTIGVLPDAVPVEGGAFKRILCATDFSPCSIAAWHYAQSLADGSGAHLALLHVVEVPPVVVDPMIGPLIDVVKYQRLAETLCRERLHALVAGAPTGHPVEELVTAGKPYREILRMADEWRSDLVVLGIHGRNPIERMLFGSTAEPVTRRATCPILTVRTEAHPNPTAV